MLPCLQPALSSRPAVRAPAAAGARLPLRRVAVVLRAGSNNGSGPSPTTSTAPLSGEVSDDEGFNNTAGEYCSIDPNSGKKAKRTLGEMEQDFLGAMTSWYYEGKPVMSDEEFALLKEELIWSGSQARPGASERATRPCVCWTACACTCGVRACVVWGPSATGGHAWLACGRGWGWHMWWYSPCMDRRAPPLPPRQHINVVVVVRPPAPLIPLPTHTTFRRSPCSAATSSAS